MAGAYHRFELTRIFLCKLALLTVLHLRSLTHCNVESDECAPCTTLHAYCRYVNALSLSLSLPPSLPIYSTFVFSLSLPFCPFLSLSLSIFLPSLSTLPFSVRLDAHFNDVSGRREGNDATERAIGISLCLPISKSVGPSIREGRKHQKQIM